MSRRACPAALACVALLADLSGLHTLALIGLFVAIPASFALMLDCYGDAVSARCGLLRPATAAGGLLLIVFSAALRSPAVVGGVPRVAVSALAIAALLTVAAAVRSPAPAVARRARRRASAVTRDDEDERLAA
jgi:hypothetical protein